MEFNVDMQTMLTVILWALFMILIIIIAVNIVK